MSRYTQVTLEKAHQLLRDGWTYLDVRTEEEFAAGHPPGALNLPIDVPGEAGNVPNPDFERVVRTAFGRGERLIVGCRAGRRSARAARVLLDAGFEHVLDMAAGWEEGRDAFGRRLPGWSCSELPVETGLPEGQRAEDVAKRQPR